MRRWRCCRCSTASRRGERSLRGRFAPGPRDGLMTGIARRTGISIRLSRTAVELTVLLTGWLLGGTVGVGTVLFAVAIGPLAQLFLRLFARFGLDSSNLTGAARKKPALRQQN